MLLALLSVALYFCVLSLLVQITWNQSVAPLFRLPEVTLYQAFCLYVLAHAMLTTNSYVVNVCRDLLPTPPAASEEVVAPS